MSRIFARVRRELGADAVIVQTRSLLRDGADPLIEVLAAPVGGGDDALTLALQRVMVESGLSRVESPESVRMTIGDLEDIAARQSEEERAFNEFDTEMGLPSERPPLAPEWLQGFVSTNGGGFASEQSEVMGAFEDLNQPYDSISPFSAPTVMPPPPVQWSPRPRIVTRKRPTQAEPEPRTDPEAPAASHRRQFIPVEPGIAGRLVSAGFAPSAARIIAERADGSASPQQALESALARADVRYPAEGRTAIITLQGAAGSGRTTALMRMALDCADSGREAILVAADSSHAGGRAQVHAYGEAIGLPVLEAFGPQDIVHAVGRAPKGACVFIDVPAGHWNAPPMPGVEHFVYVAVPAHWQSATVEAAISEFDASCAGAVLTGADLAISLTPAISIIVESHLGIAFLSSGRDIATGIGVADPFTLASGVFTTSTRETTDGRLAVTA